MSILEERVFGCFCELCWVLSWCSNDVVNAVVTSISDERAFGMDLFPSFSFEYSGFFTLIFTLLTYVIF